MKKNILISIFIFSIGFFCNNMNAQEAGDSPFFTSPINHELRVAGTFGELRTNHFHMGLDIKSSKGIVGDIIYAVASGYISRIQISSSGYGNALYIDHPNGFTSVYGHLLSFNEDIEKYIKQEQSKAKSFEVNLILDPDQFPIIQGTQIAKMGNTGASNGPHLHFEIRKSKSEVPVNPMRFGIKPIDKASPKINSAKIYYFNDSLQEVGTNIQIVKKASTNNYQLLSDTLNIGSQKLGFGILTTDPMNDNANVNGVYKISMYVDSELTYEIELDSIGFDETRYINAHIDYPSLIINNKRYNRCYRLPGNNLGAINNTEKSIVELTKKPKKIDIVVSDFAKNESILSFWVKQDETLIEFKPTQHDYTLKYNEANIIDQDIVKIYFPEQCFYEDSPIDINISNEKSKNFASTFFTIGNKLTPLHRNANIFIKNNTISASQKEKTCLVYCENPNRLVSYGGKWQDGYFASEINKLGKYALYIDTIPPSISISRKNDNFTNYSSISFVIDDNLSYAGNTSQLTYQATIDNKWVLFKYDLKYNRITHYFEDPPNSEMHNLNLEVMDDRGNKKIYTKKFLR